MSESTDDQEADEQRTRLPKWAKWGGYAGLTALAIGGAISLRVPAVASAAAKTLEYAPRPNKDVSWQARDAAGRFMKN